MPGDDLGAPAYPYDEEHPLELDDQEGGEETEDGLGQRYYRPKVLNALMRILVNKIPSNQLRDFQRAALFCSMSAN